MKLHIADNLSLPLDFVTQTQAILAMRRRGKTYTASVQAEELLKAGQQIVVIDITGAWWGLKSSADGKSEAFNVVVAGGEHADIPLNPDAGPLLAQAIVADRFSCILDLKLLRKGQRMQFLAGFLETFHAANRDPVHVFADEADDYIPQTIMWKEPNASKCLGAMDDMVRRGGIHGIGCTLITQRPAVINNNVLTQCGMLTLLRLQHPADIKPIRDWVKVHATQDEEKRVIDALPTLGLGSAIVWSPGWPEDRPIGIRHVQIRERETFNSSRTPKAGERLVQPKVLARPDLHKLGQRIAELAEKAKAEDPREQRRKNAELQKRIAELEKQLQAKPAAEPPRVERIEIPVLKNGQLDKAHKLTERLEAALAQLSEVAGPLKQAIQRAEQLAAASPSPPKPAAASSPAKSLHKPLPVPQKTVQTETSTAVADERPSGPQQRILDVLAWLESVRLPQAKRTQLALLAEQSPTSSAFGNNLGALKNEKGMHPWPRLIDYPVPGLVCLTDAGRAAAHAPEVSPTTEAMHQSLFARLPGPQTRILQALIAAYPEPVDREQLAEQTGQSATSSAYGNNLGALRSVGLVDYPAKGQVVALPVLFLD